MTDREQLCKEFTELTGGHWHEIGKKGKCSCGYSFFPDEIYYHLENNNSTYENPADVLRVMMEREDGIEFVEIVGGYDHCDWPYVKLAFIIEPDALLKAVVEWLKEKK
jgi:hypothetical protein